MNQLQKGIMVESEHKDTINMIKKACKIKNKCPSNKEIYIKV
jgi:hypothetical protein